MKISKALSITLAMICLGALSACYVAPARPYYGYGYYGPSYYDPGYGYYGPSYSFSYYGGRDHDRGWDRRH